MRQSVSQTLRTYPWRHQLLCLLPLLLLLCHTAAFVGTGNDLTLYFMELKARRPFLTGLMQFLTNWTNIAFYLVYAALFILGLLGGNRDRIRFALTFMAVQIFVAALLVQMTKIAVGRPRPLLLLEGAACAPFSGKGAFHSFPSGHTAEVAGAAFPLANRYKRPPLSLFLGLIVALIGFSRIYLSMHHISDVAGGLAAGVLAGLLNHHLCSRREQL